MHCSRTNLPAVYDADGITVRIAEWGGMYAGLQSFPAGFDNAPYLQGLPDDRCQCPHWGYVLKGAMRVRYADREELVQAGEIYYLAPGHTVVAAEDIELVEFAPKAEFEQSMEAVNRNIAALQQV